jgi:Hydrogenase/urease nickel incorporation, metallochaperone, hypA
MHEMSVAMEICRIAEQHVEPDQLCDVVELGVDLGDEAGLEPANLEFCLEALLAAPPFGRGRPAISLLSGDVLRLTYVEVDDAGPED